MIATAVTIATAARRRWLPSRRPSCARRRSDASASPPDCVAALKAKNLATTAGSKQLLLPALRATLLQSYMPAAEAAQAPTAMETA